MKYLKTFQGVVTGSFAGRDDGYPETKYRYYNDFKSLALEFGKEKSEKYFLLQSLDVDELKKEVAFALNETKKEKIAQKKASIEEEIKKLQKQLNDLNKQ